MIWQTKSEPWFTISRAHVALSLFCSTSCLLHVNWSRAQYVASLIDDVHKKCWFSRSKIAFCHFGARFLFCATNNTCTELYKNINCQIQKASTIFLAQLALHYHFPTGSRQYMLLFKIDVCLYMFNTCSCNRGRSNSSNDQFNGVACVFIIWFL